MQDAPFSAHNITLPTVGGEGGGQRLSAIGYRLSAIGDLVTWRAGCDIFRGHVGYGRHAEGWHMTQDARVAGLALALGHQGEPGRLGEHAERAGRRAVKPLV